MLFWASGCGKGGIGINVGVVWTCEKVLNRWEDLSLSFHGIVFVLGFDAIVGGWIVHWHNH